jgi:hypothetical protein
MAARYRPKRLLRTPCEHKVAIHAIGRAHVAERGRRVWARRSTSSTIPNLAANR